MLKIISKFIIFFLFSICVSTADIIKNVEINGNKRVSKESILVLGGIKINDDFNSYKLNETLKKLYETGFFNNINLSLENGLLKLDVTENPIIENIEITGIKKKSFVEIIYEKMTLKNRMSFTETEFKKDIDLINILKSMVIIFLILKAH